MGYGIITVFNQTGVGQQVNSAAQQVWFDVEHPKSNIDPRDINIDDPNNSPEALKEFLTSAKVTKIPTVIFYRHENRKIKELVAKISGQTTYAKIKKIWLAILNEQSIPVGDDGDGMVDSDFGFFPGGSGLKLPKFAWWIALGVSTYKTAESETGVGQTIWGAAAVTSLINALK